MKILGLDLGTNSIGWALLDNDNQTIIKSGSRIIPMDAATLGAFQAGNMETAAKARTHFRGTRRLYQRATLRRERLLRVLNILGFLPEHFKKQIDFDNHPGQFINHSEPLLPYFTDGEDKSKFLFIDSFNEMLADFKKYQPKLVEKNKKVPYDWTIYYLRKKALSRPILKEELAWIILNFNTKRGYYQLRGEEEQSNSNTEEYQVLEVIDVKKMDADKKRKGVYWYEVIYNNQATQRKSGIVPPRKIGDKVEVIVTTSFDKKGNPKITLRDPKPDDWKLMKKRSENAIAKSGKQVGEFIYDNLLVQPDTKIRGKLIRVIERKYYKEELLAILRKQREYIPKLSDPKLFDECVLNLYQNNQAHRTSLQGKTIVDFIVDDIIFYQRPLKSKKGEISHCPYEHYFWINKETGEIVKKPINCIPKSHPLFQEFRLWQFIQNLRIYQREKEIDGQLKMDVDVTNDFLQSEEDISALFDWLNNKKDINQEQLLKFKPFGIGANTELYRWNYPEDKVYPCNETHFEIIKRLSDIEGSPSLSEDEEIDLWHILYSVDDIIDLRKALTSFALSHHIDKKSMIDSFINMKPFEADYGAYSEKAIKKLLSLMRTGQHWSYDTIDKTTQQKIEQIIAGHIDEHVAKRIKKQAYHLKGKNDFKNLPLWLASYIIYERHSEAIDTSQWKTPDDIDYYLKNTFKQNALRNPLVSSIIAETLRVVRDIWKTYGNIDEIHVEMGRDLKANSEERRRRSENISRNERTNLRIRLLLQEFLNPQYGIEDVRPQSPSHQEILKIYEDAVLHDGTDIPDDILLISDQLGNPSKHVSSKDINRYILWMEQKYKSPYTGQPIPLSKLFTHAYEIEHIIPQSLYFDDSLSNKVICESEVNKLKDRQLGYEFIINKGGSIIEGNFGKKITILDKKQYEDFVKQHYSNNRVKMRKLLMEEIPDSFIQRQLNDSRYIARKTIEILSHIVREDGETEAVSKNVISTNGSITDRLKKDWGLHDVWNEIISPRFIRLNKITKSNEFGNWVNKNGKRYFQINVPLSISQGFSKKRIDHRHHAMDAIVIAATTRDHVNYLNNQSALSSKKDMRHDLQHKLCVKVKTDHLGNYQWVFKKPWDTFTQDVRQQLSSIIISYKQNLRVITKMTNYFTHYVNGEKVIDRQVSSDGWAIRKSLHKATISGAVRLQRVRKVKLEEALRNWHQITDKKIRKAIGEVIKLYHMEKVIDIKTLLKYFKDRNYMINETDIRRLDIYEIPDVADFSATRVELDTSFDKKKIDAVTDSGIRKILIHYLCANNNDPNLAFSPEGIATMNRNIKELNDGHDHQPIYKVRKSEALGSKFAIGYRGTKKKKLSEGDKGTNLFFAVYSNELGERTFRSIPFNEAVERLKNGLKECPEIDENGNHLMFTLSPNDLVYIPKDKESIDEPFDWNRIYKMVSCSSNRCYFIPQSIAYPIVQTLELGVNNKTEKLLNYEDCNDKANIKSECLKLSIDRLGNIYKIQERV